MPASPIDEAAWEKIWRESDDDSLTESANVHLWQCFQSPQPGFGRCTQICREAHRRGKPELIMKAVAAMTPIRTASGEDVRVLLRQMAELRAALILAGKEIVELNFGKRDTELLQMMRARLREARAAAEWLAGYESLDRLCPSSCPHCGAANASPGFASLSADLCRECGKAVDPPAVAQGSGRR